MDRATSKIIIRRIDESLTTVLTVATNDSDRSQSPDGYEEVDWYRTSQVSYDACARAKTSIQLWPLEYIVPLYNYVDVMLHRYASKGPWHGHDHRTGKEATSWSRSSKINCVLFARSLLICDRRPRISSDSSRSSRSLSALVLHSVVKAS